MRRRLGVRSRAGAARAGSAEHEGSLGPAAALLLSEPSGAAEPRLTQRELECLRWTLRGKTAWEVGCILGIAEQTAARHLHNASKKLGCVSKHQAALKAVDLRLIVG